MYAAMHTPPASYWPNQSGSCSCCVQAQGIHCSMQGTVNQVTVIFKRVRVCGCRVPRQGQAAVSPMTQGSMRARYGKGAHC